MSVSHSAGAVVGLEQTFLAVTEDDGVIELCAIVSFPAVSCPIQLPVEVRLTTTDGTAGKDKTQPNLS